MRQWWMIGLVGLAIWPWGDAQAQAVSSSLPAVVSATVPASPWLVSGVVVTITDTTGFARDVALERAARQALPKVLAGPLGLPVAEANRKAKAVGEALQFVSRYQLMKESILPNYTLTVDLHFNEAMLRKNFGGVVSQTAPNAPMANPTVATSNTTPSPAPSAIAQRWVVRVNEPTAAGQDRARRALAALPATTVTLRLIAPQGVEFMVASNQPPAVLREALAGWQPELTPVTEHATPTPSSEPAAAPATVPMVTPGAPAAPAAPSRQRPAWLPDLW